MRKAAFVADRTGREGRDDSARPHLASAISDGSGAALEAVWESRRLSTDPADRDAAEDGVRIAYREAGLAPPRIVWCDGPIGLARSWASAPSCVGPSMRDDIVAPIRQALRRLEMHPDRRLARLRDAFAHGRSCAIGSALRAAVLEDAEAVRPSLRSCMRRLGSVLTGMRGPPGFAAGGWSQHELCLLGFDAALLDLLEPGAAAGLRGLRLVAGNAGWMVPHARACWLSDRPDVLSFDPWGRLHAASGPAVRYRDGWCAYAWKGARVPSWIIEQPHRIDVRWIDAQIDPLVRRAMIDILTPERFVDAGGADCVARNAAGTLWARRWFHRGCMIDSWAAVELPLRGDGQDGSGRRVLRCVPGHVRTPDEALAWLFGPASRKAAALAPAQQLSLP